MEIANIVDGTYFRKFISVTSGEASKLVPGINVVKLLRILRVRKVSLQRHSLMESSDMGAENKLNIDNSIRNQGKSVHTKA